MTQNLEAITQIEGTSRARLGRRSAAKLAVPMIECNAPATAIEDLDSTIPGARPDERYDDFVIRGMELYRRAGYRRIIVTTRSASIDSLYGKLYERFNGLCSVIGGVKTMDHIPGCKPGDSRPYHYADPEAWAAIGNDCVKIATLTGEKIVVLMQETALAPYDPGVGGGAIDGRALHRVIRELDAQMRIHGITLLLYQPTVTYGGERGLLARIFFEALHNAQFLAGYSGRPGHLLDPVWHGRRKEQNSAAPNRLWDLMFCADVPPGGRGLETWSVHDAERYGQFMEYRVVLYPHLRNWLSVAEAVTR